jgi:hypothetical protein
VAKNYFGGLFWGATEPFLRPKKTQKTQQTPADETKKAAVDRR